ncbi:hypothetical protein EDB87DRAFT_1659513 [Lactarius vividus]|nr:hypothetical protein EDB87DRAFT_1659513 [Lactarius vividus]
MPIHLLALHLSLYQWPVAEIAAVVEVNTNTEHIVAAGRALPAGPMWKGCLNMWSSLATFWGRSHGAARYAPCRIVRSP